MIGSQRLGLLLLGCLFRGLLGLGCGGGGVFDGGLRSCETGDGHAVGRAGDVVESELVAGGLNLNGGRTANTPEKVIRILIGHYRWI